MMVHTEDEAGERLEYEEIRGQVPAWHPVTCGGCKHLDECKGEKPESSDIRPHYRGYWPCYEPKEVSEE